MARGTVVTYYSYKGGVGRSLTLANTACQLAQWGFRVLCIDFDLEAPGLDRYFGPLLSRTPKRGVIDLITSREERISWQETVVEASLPDARHPISLIPAGDHSDRYIERLQSIDWSRLYRKDGLGGRLELVREEWINSFDFVLVDSRTGVSDIGSICTVQLPDILATHFTTTAQSVVGGVRVAERARGARHELPYDRARLLVLPIAARLDARVEYELTHDWITQFIQATAPLYDDWLPAHVSREAILSQYVVPYVPYWSYGERLPLLEEPSAPPGSISHAFQTIAALIARRLEDAEMLTTARDSYVLGARSAAARHFADAVGAPQQLPPRVHLFYEREDLKNAMEAKAALDALPATGLASEVVMAAAPGGVVLDMMEADSSDATVQVLLLSSIMAEGISQFGSKSRWSFGGLQRSIPVVVATGQFRWSEVPFAPSQVVAPLSEDQTLRLQKRVWTEVTAMAADAATTIVLERSVRYSEGDLMFLEESRLLPAALAIVSRLLLAKVRSTAPGTFEFAPRSGRFVNRPDNYWTARVQPKDGSLLITARGMPDRLRAGERLTLKVDRPGYSRFKVRSRLDLEEALLILGRAKWSSPSRKLIESHEI